MGAFRGAQVREVVGLGALATRNRAIASQYFADPVRSASLHPTLRTPRLCIALPTPAPVSGYVPQREGLQFSGTHAVTQAPSRVAIHAPRGAERDTVAPDRVAVVEQRIVQQRWCRCRGRGQGQPFGREDQFHYPRCDRGDRTTSRRRCKCVTPVYEVRARFLRRCGKTVGKVHSSVKPCTHCGGYTVKPYFIFSEARRFIIKV